MILKIKELREISWASFFFFFLIVTNVNADLLFYFIFIFLFLTKKVIILTLNYYMYKKKYGNEYKNMMIIMIYERIKKKIILILDCKKKIISMLYVYCG